MDNDRLQSRERIMSHEGRCKVSDLPYICNVHCVSEKTNQL